MHACIHTYILTYIHTYIHTRYSNPQLKIANAVFQDAFKGFGRRFRTRQRGAHIARRGRTAASLAGEIVPNGRETRTGGVIRW